MRETFFEDHVGNELHKTQTKRLDNLFMMTPEENITIQQKPDPVEELEIQRQNWSFA